MPHLILFNKPYRVLSRFTDEEGRPTLADFIDVPGVYPCGRLDFESEGLLVLTDQGWLQSLISDPIHKLPKTYLVQVEGVPDAGAMTRLREGVELSDGRTRPARADVIDAPDVPPRTPPIRARKSVPTSWLRLTISEGRNRQVRRMTAAVGHPTLRLIRQKIGPWRIGGMLPGEWIEVPCPGNEREFRRVVRG